jgi:putative transposase
MARPARNARPGNILSCARTFFATTKTSQGRALLQSERNATLMIDVLRSYVAARQFVLHDFVVMPNHLHLLVTVGEGTARLKPCPDTKHARRFDGTPTKPG